MSRAVSAVGFGVGIASHLVSRRPMSRQPISPITPTKCLLLFMEDSP